MAAPRDWDGTTYDRIADPMTRWGSDVLDRLPLAGGESVLDAGCGSGRVTERLAQRLPHGRVIALDGSPAMIDAARDRLARFGDRIEYVVADLGAPLPLPTGSVDAILSTATFHWVKDHEALFRHLAAVLRPGGRLAAQCGGAGNIASVRAALAALGEDADDPWTFATPQETEARLRSAGFTDIEAWLHDEPTPIAAGEPMHEFLRTVVLGAQVARVPEGEQAIFVSAVADRLPASSIDYVRLNILATRA